MEIIKESTKEAWLAVLKFIFENGKEIIDHDRRISKELLNLTITITDPKDDVTEPIRIMRELKKWVYPELDELQDVMFQKESSNVYYYTYGARLFSYANIKNQIDDFIIPLLIKDKNTRRAIAMLYYPLSDSMLDAKEAPGLISIYFKIIEGKLTASTLLRSNDMFIGWPANIYQIYTLQKYIAQKIGVMTGSITTISHSAHLFQEYKEEIEEVLRKK
jgi:thymidylate synthase